MSPQALETALAIAAAMTLGGSLLGLAYFACLRRTAALFAAGDGWARPAVLTLARLCAVTVAFAAAARLGALPLLAGFGGFLAARAFALHQARRAA